MGYYYVKNWIEIVNVFGINSGDVLEFPHPYNLKVLVLELYVTELHYLGIKALIDGKVCNFTLKPDQKFTRLN